MRNVTVSRYMTRGAHTIGLGETLEAAHRLMNDHAIRHLPVLKDGHLVGVVSQRDLYFVETLRDVDPSKVTVEEAMTSDAYAVSGRAPLRVVARAMAERKVGSAIVLDDEERVVGIFTVTDGMRVLAELLD